MTNQNAAPDAAKPTRSADCSRSTPATPRTAAKKRRWRRTIRAASPFDAGTSRRTCYESRLKYIINYIINGAFVGSSTQSDRVTSARLTAPLPER